MAGTLFIALEGLDGCGKTSQGRLLADWLRAHGRQVTEVADPGGTAIGERIRELLLHGQSPISTRAEALLFMASRAQLVAEVIQPALAAGHDIVSDRFVLANVVYQGYGGGLMPAELWHMGKWSANGLEPDLTLILDLPVQAARRRRPIPADSLEGRAEPFHERVRAGYLSEAKRCPERIRVIDATPAPAVIHAAIIHALEPYL